MKLLNVCDPGRWRSGYGNGLEEDELSKNEDEEMVDGESQVDMEEVDCMWVDEEDFIHSCIPGRRVWIPQLVSFM